MSEYMRSSFTLKMSVEGLPVRKWAEFGREVKFRRITVTVDTSTSDNRRAWKRRVKLTGFNATVCEVYGVAKNRARYETVSYSVVGTADDIDGLMMEWERSQVMGEPHYIREINVGETPVPNSMGKLARPDYSDSTDYMPIDRAEKEYNRALRKEVSVRDAESYRANNR